MTVDTPIKPTQLIDVSPGQAWNESTKVAETSKHAALTRGGLATTDQDQPKPPGTGRQPRNRSHARLRWMGLVRFLLFVVVPTGLVSHYFYNIATPQYVVETQFAVRGSNAPSLSLLGLSALPGASGQAADSYILQSYIRSQQVARDILNMQDYDVRLAFSRPFIDTLNRIEPDLPFIDLESYWQRRTKVEYNTISGNTTVQVFAFTPQDALDISNAIVRQSEHLVNSLSDESRQQLISTAEEEVQRTEQRLREARLEMQRFQNETQSINAESLVQVEVGIVATLEARLTELLTERRTLPATIPENSPLLLVLDRQIRATEEQIAAQRLRIGSGSNENSDEGNIANVANIFIELSTNQEFASEAYAVALESLEAAKADARQQERYLASYIPPELPDASRHPKPLLYTIIAGLWIFFSWLVITFLWRTIRDHIA
ncbi:hypothetical protein SLH49_15760 [Cognatiyoonia sp. IB215446]|uniref:hypothetical protein n=1 Tax=Cognatiyoonia sp. IB215446 TaxID=3097355 RepID=UPI002A16440D|nr:hypothetical protein [Cognatiyoonia sp. IB215446]MDX8349443.1 hypothetical protein [Cognatiyoonia sp. IB215446]